MTTHTFRPRSRWVRAVPLALLVTALVAGAAAAQTGGTARIFGQVRDTSTAVLPGATVEVRNQGTGMVRVTVTTETGSYVVPILPVGRYSVKISLEGFTTFVREDLLLEVDQEARVDATMGVGAITETTTVKAETPLLETRSSSLRSVVDNKRMGELPLNGRNPLELTLFIPGIQATSGTAINQSNTRPDQQFISSSGGRGNGVLYALDGGDNSDSYTNVANAYPNPDALQEFSVQTNNFTPEYGRRLGGVVNAITRSGSNAFSGSAFEYLRDASMNASNFFTPGREDGLKRNQFGGTLGGPIRRDKTFFFASYQGTRVSQVPLDRTAVVPTQAMRNGDFSGLLTASGALVVVKDPQTGLPFPGNQIPVSRFDPVAVALLQYIPVPTDSSGLVRVPLLNTLDDDQYLGKVDHQLTSAVRLTGRYMFDTVRRGNPMSETNYLASARYKDFKSHNLTASSTVVFTPRLLGVVGFTMNRVVSQQTYGYGKTLHDLGTNMTDLSFNKDISLAVNGFFSLPTVAGGVLTRSGYQFQASLTYAIASHELKAGTDILRQRLEMPGLPFNSDADWIFGGLFTGSNLTDYMLGLPSAFTQSSAQFEDLRSWNPGFFVQDVWRLNNRLTLNLGLRYEPFLPWVDKIATTTAVFSQGAQSTAAPGLPKGLLVGGDPGIPDAGYRGSYTQFDPRLGLAYVLPNNRTSIRVGYGLFHEFPNSIISNRVSLSAPYVVRVDIQNPPSLKDPFSGTIKNPYPTTVPPPPTYPFPRPVAATVYDPNFTNAYAHQWNASVEHEFKNIWLVRASYMGSRARHLMATREINAAVFTTGASTGNINQRRPFYPDFTSIGQMEATGSSNYEGVALGMERRLSKGYSVKASYTYGKSYDVNSAAAAAGVSGLYTNPNDPMYDWGRSDFDRRHRFVGTVVWALPSLATAHPVVRYALGDWQVSAIVVLESGTPFTVLAGSDRSLDGAANDRPDQTGDPALSSDRPRSEQVLQWFNTSAFQLNALGTFGTAPRNSVTGPGNKTVNLALVKSFPVKRVRLQLRAEAFNLFNWVNLGTPTNNLSSSLFGRITTAADPRIIQLAVRAVF
ncbi:MAG: TonB-dependent receptor [Acidobacteria bacterium]|nr:TonB-dependent receptor [Acidobacteriota bacterium]